MMSAVMFAHVVTTATTAGGEAAQEMTWEQVVLVVWASGVLIPIMGGVWYLLDAVDALRDDEENGRPYSAAHYQEPRHAIWTVLSSPAWPLIAYVLPAVRWVRNVAGVYTRAGRELSRDLS